MECMQLTMSLFACLYHRRSNWFIDRGLPVPPEGMIFPPEWIAKYGKPPPQPLSSEPGTNPPPAGQTTKPSNRHKTPLPSDGQTTTGLFGTSGSTFTNPRPSDGTTTGIFGRTTTSTLVPPNPFTNPPPSDKQTAMTLFGRTTTNRPPRSPGGQSTNLLLGVQSTNPFTNPPPSDKQTAMTLFGRTTTTRPPRSPGGQSTNLLPGVQSTNTQLQPPGQQTTSTQLLLPGQQTTSAQLQTTGQQTTGQQTTNTQLQPPGQQTTSTQLQITGQQTTGQQTTGTQPQPPGQAPVQRRTLNLPPIPPVVQRPRPASRVDYGRWWDKQPGRSQPAAPPSNPFSEVPDLEKFFQKSSNNKKGATRAEVLRDIFYKDPVSLFTNPAKPALPLHGAPIEQMLKTGPAMPVVSIAMMTPTEMARLQVEVHSLRMLLLDRIRKCPYADCERYFNYHVTDQDALDLHLREDHPTMACFLCPDRNQLLQRYNQEQLRAHFLDVHMDDFQTLFAAKDTGKDKPSPEGLRFEFCDRCGRNHALLNDVEDQRHHAQVCAPLKEGEERTREIYCSKCANVRSEDPDHPGKLLPCGCRVADNEPEDTIGDFCRTCRLRWTASMSKGYRERHVNRCMGLGGHEWDWCPFCGVDLQKSDREARRRHGVYCHQRLNGRASKTKQPGDDPPPPHTQDKDNSRRQKRPRSSTMKATAAMPPPPLPTRHTKTTSTPAAKPAVNNTTRPAVKSGRAAGKSSSGVYHADPKHKRKRSTPEQHDDQDGPYRYRRPSDQDPEEEHSEVSAVTDPLGNLDPDAPPSPKKRALGGKRGSPSSKSSSTRTPRAKKPAPLVAEATKDTDEPKRGGGEKSTTVSPRHPLEGLTFPLPAAAARASPPPPTPASASDLTMISPRTPAPPAKGIPKTPAANTTTKTPRTVTTVTRAGRAVRAPRYAESSVSGSSVTGTRGEG
ncbi:hypothetical protein F4780DRAFT_514697 [Xylariomycetidae sp. FL0641]|nr:hypothetical protein F4780DRAFT_514697 [Xylariomycetidae sp. FL0641]